MKTYKQIHDEIICSEKGAAIQASLLALLEAHEREKSSLQASVNALQASDHHRQSVGLRWSAVFDRPDGARLIERAFRADPKQTAIELNYLGAHDVAGQLKVKLGLEQRELPGTVPSAPEAYASA